MTVTYVQSLYNEFANNPYKIQDCREIGFSIYRFQRGRYNLEIFTHRCRTFWKSNKEEGHKRDNTRSLNHWWSLLSAIFRFAFRFPPDMNSHAPLYPVIQMHNNPKWNIYDTRGLMLRLISPKIVDAIHDTGKSSNYLRKGYSPKIPRIFNSLGKFAFGFLVSYAIP